MVSSLVWKPRMTSTIGLAGTGFMKCMPTTRSGRAVTEPTRVIGMAEVLTAKTTSGRQIRSSSGRAPS